MSEQDPSDMPKLPDEGLRADNIIPMPHLDREIARRRLNRKGLSEDEHLVNLQDKDSKRKIKIVGSAAAILVAAGLLAGAGFMAARKHQKKKQR